MAEATGGKSNSGGVTSVLLVGVGGQGVLKASDIVARAAFLAGFDVKKSEVHGMSQRGGGVMSTVRFGRRVFSPLAPRGSIDVIIGLERSEAEKYTGLLAPGAKVFMQDGALVRALPNVRAANVALLGRAASSLEIPDEIWEKAIAQEINERYRDMNLQAFKVGREFAGRKGAET